ncbi:fungal-specific transcription factor domain-containing protein, partial [Plectosphaerella plurivora]
MMEVSDWFAPTRTVDTPAWIGEISDAAFATRLRQFASSSQTPNHILRTQYASDHDLRTLATMSSPVWPSPPHAKLLVEAALQFMRHSYHIVRRSEVLSTLRLGSSGLVGSPTIGAKMWALFALGELQSSKCPPGSSSTDFPGLAYFAIASEAARMNNERPHLDTIETVLLLALYSLETNRRHAACTFVGTALRLATIMGLHINISQAQLPDPELREHRIRVWWSTYILDRLLSSKIGLPLLISDEDILADLPTGNPVLNATDFGDHLHFLAVLRLAKIAGHISQSLYLRRPQRGTFLQQVEKIREELDQWRGQLPGHIKTEFDYAVDQNECSRPATTALKLSYNQLLIVATRPVLLFVFRHHIGENAMTEVSLPQQAQAIAETCAQSARETLQLLSQSWIGGGFHNFNYSHVQYLFSAAVVLAIASTLDTSHDDGDQFLLAASFLGQLERNGNFAAMEFHSHVKETQRVLDQLRSASRLPAADHPQVLPTDIDGGTSAVLPADSHEFENVLPMDLSFLDDWIYENALEQLCW